MLRIILMWLISIVFLAALTTGFYFVLRAKSLLLIEALDNFSTDPERFASQRNGAIALVYIALFAVILFNKLVLSYILHYLTEKECHETASQEQLSFALKYALGLFFTTAVMTLAVEGLSLIHI